MPVRYTCAYCCQRIRDSVQRSGKLVPAAQCAATAQKRFGRPLCKACLLKAIKQEKEDAHDPSEAAQSNPGQTAAAAQP